MPVAVMRVGRVLVAVAQPRMRVLVGMRLARRIAWAMRVLVMRVVSVSVAVHHRLVLMFVLVPLR
jgi:hypothetical protein